MSNNVKYSKLTFDFIHMPINKKIKKIIIFGRIGFKIKNLSKVSDVLELFFLFSWTKAILHAWRHCSAQTICENIQSNRCFCFLSETVHGLFTSILLFLCISLSIIFNIRCTTMTWMWTMDFIIFCILSEHWFKF